jgi:hypothetical protein
MNLQQALVIILAELDKREINHTPAEFLVAKAIAKHHATNSNVEITSIGVSKNTLINVNGTWIRHTLGG